MSILKVKKYNSIEPCPFANTLIVSTLAITEGNEWSLFCWDNPMNVIYCAKNYQAADIEFPVSLSSYFDKDWLSSFELVFKSTSKPGASGEFTDTLHFGGLPLYDVTFYGRSILSSLLREISQTLLKKKNWPND